VTSTGARGADISAPEPNFQAAKFINGINNLAAHLDPRTALTALTVLTH
jgi:hypothetical protein